MVNLPPLHPAGLCPDWDQWDQTKPVDNAREAMQQADDWLGIPQVRRGFSDPPPLWAALFIRCCFLLSVSERVVGAAQRAGSWLCGRRRFRFQLPVSSPAVSCGLWDVSVRGRLLHRVSDSVLSETWNSSVVFSKKSQHCQFDVVAGSVSMETRPQPSTVSVSPPPVNTLT